MDKHKHALLRHDCDDAESVMSMVAICCCITIVVKGVLLPTSI